MAFHDRVYLNKISEMRALLKSPGTKVPVLQNELKTAGRSLAVNECKRAVAL